LNGYYFDNSLPNERKFKEEERIDESELTAMALNTFIQKTKNTSFGFHFEKAIFLSYAQVRNDSEYELKSYKQQCGLSFETEAGIEMEAYAMLHALRLKQVSALPIIKAVSDVGIEVLDLSLCIDDTSKGRAKKNVGVLQQNVNFDPFAENDQNDCRKKYRKYAGGNAAVIMVEFLLHLSSTPHYFNHLLKKRIQ